MPGKSRRDEGGAVEREGEEGREIEGRLEDSDATWGGERWWAGGLKKEGGQG